MFKSFFSPTNIGRCIALGLSPMVNRVDSKIVDYTNINSSEINRDQVDNDESGRCIILFWHEYILAIAPAYFSEHQVTALCSMHRDGEVVARTAEAMGLNIVLGSTSRGGAKAIRQLKQAAKHSSIAITPDGPRGPRREMTVGAIFLAAKIGLPIVPVGVGVASPYRFKTWDQFVAPLPWSRIRIILGPKIYLPKRLRKDDLESHRLSCDRLLNDLSDQAEAWAVSGTDLPGQKRYVRRRRRYPPDHHDDIPSITEGSTTPTKPTKLKKSLNSAHKYD